jgi:hypothetical protein
MPPMSVVDAMSDNDHNYWQKHQQPQEQQQPQQQQSQLPALLKPRRSILKNNNKNNNSKNGTEGQHTSSSNRSNHPASIMRHSSSGQHHHHRSSSNTTTPPVVGVTFSQSLDVHEICHFRDLSPEDVEATWYSTDDFDEIKKSLVVTLRLMMADKPVGDDQCTRGLEFRTPQGAKYRKRNKVEALTAVWNEQVQQWQNDVVDDEAIRRVYLEHSIKCRDAARKFGIHDEKVIRKYIKEGQTTSTTTTTSTISPTSDDNNNSSRSNTSLSSMGSSTSSTTTNPANDVNKTMPTTLLSPTTVVETISLQTCAPSAA